LAVDEINAAGGIDGKQIEVVDKDNKSETAEAASVTTNLVTQSKVSAIVGPATSGATAAAVANATKAGVPLISPSATQDGLTKGLSELSKIASKEKLSQTMFLKNCKLRKLFFTLIMLATMLKVLPKPSVKLTRVKSLQMKLS